MMASRKTSEENSSEDDETALLISKPSMGKRSILKNLLIVCSFPFVFYLGYQALANLQSTMNGEKGLGMDSQAVMYGAMMLSSVLLPKILIKRLGCKSTLIFSILLSSPYIAANFYPRWQTLVPTAVLFGLSAGPFSTSACFYITEMASRYKAYVPDTLEAVSAKFFGINSFFIENTQIWGNMISYLVLRPSTSVDKESTYHNASDPKCGISFDNFLRFNYTNISNPNLEPPTDEKRFTLVGIYTVLCLLSAFLLWLCLEPLESDVDVSNEDGHRHESVSDRLLATVAHLWNPNQLLLLPLTIYAGLEVAFYTGDFTEAYIACAWGVHHVGFVSICFGVCGALTAVLVWPLVNCVGQTTLLVGAALVHISACVVLFMWDSSHDSTTVFFLVSGLWGAADAVLCSQICALYGLLFSSNLEAAFSNLFFWNSLGYFMSYSYANYLSIPVKLNILLCFLITGILGLLVVKIRVKCLPRHVYINVPEKFVNGNERSVIVENSCP